MAGENEAETILSYRLNNQSISAAIQANKNVEASLKSVGAAATGSALRFDSIAQAQAALGLSAQQLGLTEGVVTNELQRQLPLAERLAQAAQVRASAEAGTAASLRASAFAGGVASAGGGAAARGGRSLGQNITKAGRDLFNLPDVGGSTTISRLLILAGAGVDKLGISAGNLAKGLGVTAAAAVPVLLAFEAFNQQLKQSKNLLEGALSAQKNYFTALEDQTEEQVKLQVDNLRDQRPLLVQQIEETRASMRAAFGVDDTAQGEGARFQRGLGKLLAPELFESLDEQSAALEENIQTEARLTAGLKDGSFAANTAAEAEELLAEARLKTTEAILQAQNDYADSFVRGQTLTTAEREKEIASLEQQKASYEELIASGTQSGDSIQLLNGTITDLDNQIAGLQDASSKWADDLERLANAQEALTERNDAYLDLIDQEVEAREEAFAIQEKILAIEAERDDRIREIEADRDERLLELTEGSEERRVEIIADAADRIAKIERDAGRDRTNAIANRDALAFTLSEQRRDDALADQQTALDKSFKQIEKNLDKQEKALEKSYGRQLDNVVDSSNKQLQVQYNALTQANFLIQSALAAQNAHVQSGWQLIVGGTEQGMMLLRNTVVANIYNMVNDVAGIFGSIRGGFSQFPTLTSTHGAAQPSQRYIQQEVTNQLYGYFRAASPVGTRF